MGIGGVGGRPRVHRRAEGQLLVEVHPGHRHRRMDLGTRSMGRLLPAVEHVRSADHDGVAPPGHDAAGRVAGRERSRAPLHAGMARIEVHPLPLHGEVTRAVLAAPPEIRLGEQPAVARRDVQLEVRVGVAAAVVLLGEPWPAALARRTAAVAGAAAAGVDHAGHVHRLAHHLPVPVAAVRRQRQPAAGEPAAVPVDAGTSAGAADRFSAARRARLEPGDARRRVRHAGTEQRRCREADLLHAARCHGGCPWKNGTRERRRDRRRRPSTVDCLPSTVVPPDRPRTRHQLFARLQRIARQADRHGEGNVAPPLRVARCSRHGPC